MQQLGEDLFTKAQSLKLPGGVDIGTRMTVIRIGESLLLHSPVRIDDALAKELEALGQVRWLVAPCTFHHLFIARAKQRWPDAEIWTAPGVEKKQKTLTIDGDLSRRAPEAWADALDVSLIEGMPRLNEVALLHRPSGTLVLTDFLFNIQHMSSWWGRSVLSMMGSYGGPRQSRLLRAAMQDRAAVTRSRDRLLAWDFTRVSVCHGDVIEDRAKDVLAETTAWIG